MRCLDQSDHQLTCHAPVKRGWGGITASNYRVKLPRQITASIKEAGPESPFTRQDDGSYLVQIGDQVLVVPGDATLREIPSSIVYYDKPARSEKHPTTKPVGLIVKQLVNNARRNDVVVDAFGGSAAP
jgi:DNA modification methylase